MSSLDGSHVLVFGATGGLGAPLAKALAGQGATLTLSARSAERLAAVAAELGDAVVGTVPGDLTMPDAARSVVEAATADGRALDGVVFAAGVVAFGAVTDLDDDALDAVLLLNLVAPIRVARAAIPKMGRGAFFATISAITAERPTAGMAAYSASKAAVTAFDAALGHELRRTGIRVLDIRPPHTETGLAGRPIAGTAPALGKGKQPTAVADRIVRALLDDEKDLPSGAFG